MATSALWFPGSFLGTHVFAAPRCAAEAQWPAGRKTSGFPLASERKRVGLFASLHLPLAYRDLWLVLCFHADTSQIRNPHVTYLAIDRHAAGGQAAAGADAAPAAATGVLLSLPPSVSDQANQAGSQQGQRAWLRHRGSNATASPSGSRSAKGVAKIRLPQVDISEVH